MKSLLGFKGALAYLIAVFLNAAVDLGHKIILQNSLFKLYEGPEQVLLTAVVNALILLPFILLLSPAGFISDRFAKNKVLRFTAWMAVVLTCLITCFYYLGWFWLAFATTFLLAGQSAVYSPAKYSYLKLLFGKGRLAEANGLAQAVSIIAILSGTFLFSIFFEMAFPDGADSTSEVIQAMAPAGLALVIASLIELWFCYQLPELDQSEGDIQSQIKAFPKKDYLTGKMTRQNIQVLSSRKGLWLAVLGLSMFWGLGQVLLASYPAFAKEALGITNTILIQGTLAATGVGIALGAAVAARISRGYIETALIPLGALGITLGLWLVPNISSAVGEIVCFLGIGFSGGLFIVPLNALVQFYASEEDIGRVIAANNWVQNICMLSLLVIVFVSASLAIDARQILVAAACIAFVGSLFTVYKLPQSLARFLLSGLIQRRYKVQVQGMKNIPEEGGVLMLGNHVSWMDWAILQIASPRPIRFVMARSIFDRWYLNKILKFFGCIPVQPGASSKVSLEEIAKLLNQGEVVCLFPEGTLSRTGHLTEFKKGFKRACELANQEVAIVPFYLRGLWGSQLSYAQGNLKKASGKTLKREIIVGFGEPQSKGIDAAELKRRIFDLSTKTWETYGKELPSLTLGCIEGLCRNRHKVSLVEFDGTEISRSRVLAGASLFASYMRKSNSEAVGIILPSGAGATIANLAALMAGKVPVNLNYTANMESLKSSIQQAGITEIYTSSRFVHKLYQRGIDLNQLNGPLNGPLEPHRNETLKLLYMEEIRAGFGKIHSLFCLLAARLLPAAWFRLRYAKAVSQDATATLLFSSGSEGQPKGVELSHTNVMSNIKQISEVLDPQSDEVMIASLPPFHAFGLTVTLFMPLVEGIKTVCQPDPANARGTARLIAEHRATMLFGTSTFLRLYMQDKKVHPAMLETLRIVVAGAEKLRDDVRSGFKLKFGKEILEGYGCTETAPVSAVNIPDRLGTDRVRVHLGQRTGSVGMPLPGTSFKVVDPETWEELETNAEGMVLIAGPQIMKGYLNAPEKTDSVIREKEGLRWYVTGDKGRVDADGFLWVVDRYSRFAKIGGEMVSLGAVEEVAERVVTGLFETQGKLSDEALPPEVMATARPDEKKGEVVVLLTTAEMDLKAFRSEMMDKGISPLMLPDKILVLDELPRLGSGKPDHNKAKELAAKA